MKLYLVISFALCINFAAASGRRRIMMYHPDVSQHYLQNYMKNTVPSANHGDGRSRFSHMEKHLKLGLCLEMVNSVTYFASVPQDMKPIEAELINNDQHFHTIKETYKTILLDTTKYLSIKVHTNKLFEIEKDQQSFLSVQTIPCMLSEDIFLAIEDGYDVSQMYVIFKDKLIHTIPLSIFMALIEYGAETDEETKMEDLESSFLLSQKMATDNGKPKKNICTLSSFDQFRMCSSIYGVWNKKSGHENWNYIREQHLGDDTGNSYCVEEADIQFTSEDDKNNFQSVGYNSVELIPCAINEEWYKPNFYVTADQNDDEKAYVLESYNEEQFFLVMHVKNVVALRNAF